MKRSSAISYQLSDNIMRLRPIALGCALLGASLTAGCDSDKLLEVQSPSRVPAEALESDPANANLFVNSAIANFDCAFGAYIVVGGLIGEELQDATQTASRYPYDQRNVQPDQAHYSTFGCEAIGVYAPLQTARVSANSIRRRLEGWTDAQVDVANANRRRELLATATAYEAYAILLLGEGFCTTTISTIDLATGTTEFGAELSRADAFTQAEERFTQAITEAQAVNATALLNLALVGRARARLNLAVTNGAVTNAAKLAEARADAATVPATFAHNMTASAVISRRENRVWAQNNPLSFPTSVAPRYQALNDPRVPVANTGRTAAGTGLAIWQQNKFTTAGAPIPIASGDEAQLIVAEADANSAATAANAVTIINVFRARGNQGPYAGGLTPAELRAEVVEQRRRELFLEGQHLGDLLRNGIQPTPAANSAFHGGGTYRDQVCMPLPNVERFNNPILRPQT
jgi:hypothetical protein